MDNDVSETRALESEIQFLPFFATIQGESLLPPSYDYTQRLTDEEFQQQFQARYRIWEAANEKIMELADMARVLKAARWLTMANNFDRYATSHHIGEKRVLREKQMDVFDDIKLSTEKGKTEGYINAPTGFGKTVLFGQVVGAADVPTVIVVPRKKLVEQTYSSIKKFNPSTAVGRVYQNRKEYGHQVTITTYQSLAADTEGKKITPEGIELVILDEVDESTSANRIRAIERFSGAMLIGLSATPQAISEPILENTRVGHMMKNEIHSISLREAVEEGYISPFSVYVAEIDADISSVRLTEAGNYNEEDLEKIIDTETKNQAAVDLFVQLRKRDDSNWPLTTSVYASSVAHAQTLAEKFREIGISAAAVWGEQNSKEQESIMSKWANGQIEVVCSKDLIVRGNDIPKIRLVLNIAPTASKTVEQQRSGRGLRLDEDNPSKHAIVVDFVYKNSNKKGRQVLFSEIMDAAEIRRKALVHSKHGEQIEEERSDQIDISSISIEELRIITNVNEVMTLTKNLTESMVEILPVQPTDFPMTENYLEGFFIGNSRVLADKARNAFKDIKNQYPELVEQRKSGSNIINVVTDRQLIIAALLERGATLRDESIMEVATTDFIVTVSSLKTMFAGNYSKSQKVAMHVLEEIAADNPNVIMKKKRGSSIVTVVTDRALFLQKMQEKGLALKDEAVQEVQDTDVLLTKSGLTSIFAAGDKKLKLAAKQVVESLKLSNPEIFSERRNATRQVPVITNQALFIQKMQEQGINLRNDSIQPVKATDFPIIQQALTKNFGGKWEYLKNIALEVIAEARIERPDLVDERINGPHIRTVITDRDYFITKMQERGVRLKDNQ